MSEESIPQASDEDRRAQETLDEVVRSIVKPSLDEMIATIKQDNTTLREAIHHVRRHIDDVMSAASKAMCGDLAEYRDEVDSQSRALQILLAGTQTANQEGFSAIAALLEEAAEATQSLSGQVPELREALQDARRQIDDATSATSKAIRCDLAEYRDEVDSQSHALQIPVAETQTANPEGFSAIAAHSTKAAEATQSLSDRVTQFREDLNTGSRIIQDTRSDLQRYCRSLWIVAGLVGVLTVVNLVFTVIWHA